MKNFKMNVPMLIKEFTHHGINVKTFVESGADGGIWFSSNVHGNGCPQIGLSSTSYQEAEDFAMEWARIVAQEIRDEQELAEFEDKEDERVALEVTEHYDPGAPSEKAKCVLARFGIKHDHPHCGPTPTLSVVETPECQHKPKEYVGLNERYTFCEVCQEKL